MEDVWKEIWPSSKVLGDYILTHSNKFKNKIILELGAGFSSIPSMVAIKCGASKVYVTDKISSDTPEIQRLQRKNLSKNLSKIELKKAQIAALDWNETQLTENLISSIASLDFIIGSDIFYDPSVFKSILQTIRIILDKFPKALFLFAYQNRDSRWSFAAELKILGLKCKRLEIAIEEDHEISIGLITTTAASSPTKTMASGDRRKIYAGVEGGATNFTFIFIDSDGEQLGEGNGLGLNILLEGIETASDKIAEALRQCAKESNIPLPIDALGLGLSGAEDDEVNDSMVEYFKSKHSDICETIHLTTDAVISIAATFKNGGIVIIAGTGSSCRLLKKDGTVYGCGGHGHLINDYGSGYWISQHAIKLLFDVEDGFVKVEHSIDHLKHVILNHFKLDNKLSLLNIFYGSKFNKAKIASLCEALAQEASSDPLISGIFHDAGSIIGKMLNAVSRNFDKSMFDNVPLLAIGSVWKSWKLLHPGFMEALKDEPSIQRVSIYQLEESPRIGAALLAAKIKLGETFASNDSYPKTRLIAEVRNMVIE